MLDVAVAYSRYQFLGNEFLTWLWFVIDNNKGKLDENEAIFVRLGNHIVFENCVNDVVERITIKGDEAGLEEGLLALRKGAVVTELNLILQEGDFEWKFGIKGESISISSLKIPETGAVEQKEDVEAVVLDKIYLYKKAADFVDKVFKKFIKLRLSDDWTEKVIEDIRAWIN